MNVIEGRGPAPLFVLSLIRRLPDTSLTVALASGGRENFGWGQDRHLLADTYDALAFNTQASGRWSSKPPTLPKYPRPEGREEDKPQVTVASLFAKFSTGNH